MIDNKFDIGQSVWSVRQTTYSHHILCGFCLGQKKIVGKNLEMEFCPRCHGTGEEMIEVPERWVMGQFGKVIQIQILDEGREHSYCFRMADLSINYAKESELYDSEAEAQCRIGEESKPDKQKEQPNEQ